jgi:hypothetical protein
MPTSTLPPKPELSLTSRLSLHTTVSASWALLRRPTLQSLDQTPERRLNMRYRFRKFLERNDWSPPQGVTLEVSYEVEYTEMPDSAGESMPGIFSISWVVVDVFGLIGRYHQPEAYVTAKIALESEPNLHAELVEASYEDFAQRQEICS